MAWTSGTASNMVDLLQDLESFLSTNGWTVLRSENFTNGVNMLPQSGGNRDLGSQNSTTSDATPEYRAIFQGPGYTGAQPPIFGIETRRFSAYNYNYWVMASAVGDNGSGPVYQLPGVSDDEYAVALLSMWDSPMDYWFAEDGGAVVGVIQVSTRFFHFYLGHYVPFATPGEIPQPAIHFGNANARFLTEYTDNIFRVCFGTMEARSEQTGAIWAGSNAPIPPATYGNTGTESFSYESDRGYRNLGTTSTDELVLYPITMFNRVKGVFGQASLIYAVAQTAVAPGSTVVVDGVTYLITNNGPYDEEYSRFAVRLG